MNDHLITIFEDESQPATIAETARRVRERDAYVAELRRSGTYVDGGRFRPSSEGKRMRGAGARMTVESGPFPGEVLASFHHVRTPTLEAAVAIAEAFPRGPNDAVEVRPPMGVHTRDGKDSLPGKVFAYAVLGAAPDERAWTQVMDRIDEETHDRFPDDRFLGGMRLRAPREGRRIAPAKDGGLVLDGPFVEAKEIIGGFFFLRAADADEAVALMKGSAFLRHGALEIRELWRA
jgi:hypothetical protein